MCEIDLDQCACSCHYSEFEVNHITPCCIQAQHNATAKEIAKLLDRTDSLIESAEQHHYRIKTDPLMSRLLEPPPTGER